MKLYNYLLETRPYMSMGYAEAGIKDYIDNKISIKLYDQIRDKFINDWNRYSWIHEGLEFKRKIYEENKEEIDSLMNEQIKRCKNKWPGLLLKCKKYIEESMKYLNSSDYEEDKKDKSNDESEEIKNKISSCKTIIQMKPEVFCYYAFSFHEIMGIELKDKEKELNHKINLF